MMFDNEAHLANAESLRMAQQSLGGFLKQAFIPAGDPGMGGGGGQPPPGGPPPGSDPAAMGGAPPPGGGAPPPPMGGGMPPPPGGGEDPLTKVMQKLEMITTQMGQGGAPGAGGGAIKPKIDVNVTLLQILKILARIADTLGVQIPASEMVPGQGDLGQLAQATQTGAPLPGMEAGGGAGGGAGAIPPIQPMGGIQPSGQPGMGKQSNARTDGAAFDTGNFAESINRSAAIANRRRHLRGEAT